VYGNGKEDGMCSEECVRGCVRERERERENSACDREREKWRESERQTNTSEKRYIKSQRKPKMHLDYIRKQ